MNDDVQLFEPFESADVHDKKLRENPINNSGRLNSGSENDSKEDEREPVTDSLICSDEKMRNEGGDDENESESEDTISVVDSDKTYLKFNTEVESMWKGRKGENYRKKFIQRDYGMVLDCDGEISKLIKKYSKKEKSMKSGNRK